MSSETKILAGIGLATVLIVAVGAFFLGASPKPATEETKVDSKLLIKSDSHKLGTDSARIKLVEFADFQCPACGASYPIVKQILEEEKGNIQFVFRHYPLPMHKNGLKASLAAEAAGVQDKFFEMEEFLYENQDEWSEKNNPEEFFEKYATELELDIEKFKIDMKDKKLEKKIKRDQADGNALGVNSTPTFFINGQKQAGGLPYDQFKAKIIEASKK